MFFALQRVVTLSVTKQSAKGQRRDLSYQRQNPIKSFTTYRKRTIRKQKSKTKMLEGKREKIEKKHK